jgi:hypothetical protein
MMERKSSTSMEVQRSEDFGENVGGKSKIR